MLDFISRPTQRRNNQIIDPVLQNEDIRTTNLLALVGVLHHSGRGLQPTSGPRPWSVLERDAFRNAVHCRFRTISQTTSPRLNRRHQASGNSPSNLVFRTVLISRCIGYLSNGAIAALRLDTCIAISFYIALKFLRNFYVSDHLHFPKNKVRSRAMRLGTK